MNHLNPLRLSQLKRASPYVIEEDNDTSVPASLAHDSVRRSQQGITVKYPFLHLRNYFFLCGQPLVALTGFLCHLKYVMWEPRLFKIDIYGGW